MAQKLYKVQKKKITAKKDAADRATSMRSLQEVVLVGTYKEKQLTWIKKNGVYNYPVKDGDEFDAEAFAKIKELWLYADAKGRRYCFKAEFVGKMLRDEFLAAYPTYVNLGRGRTPAAPTGRATSMKPPSAQNHRLSVLVKSENREYYVFKTTFLDYGPKLDDPDVLIRAMDFATGRGRARLVKKAFDQYKADGEFGSLADFLPSELSQVPHERLRVCDSGTCLPVWSPVKGMTPQLEKIESIVMSIAMFAKARNVTVARAYRSLARNGVIAHLDEHYEIESCLPIEHIVSDMEGMCGICEESVR